MKIIQKLLTKNVWSRPGRAEDIKPIKAIVLHWLAMPRGTPTGVYKFFEARKKGKSGYGSAHYCIGMDGDGLQYIPDNEMAYHVGSKVYTDFGLSLSSYPNNCTIGIEMSHLNWEGEFTDETWESTKKLTALLLMQHNLTAEDITTHMKIVGWKDCPRWFKIFPEELDRFKREVRKLLVQGIKGEVIATFLNVRDGIGGKKLGSLKKGSKITLLGIYNGWYKVEFGKEKGWCYSKYIKL